MVNIDVKFARPVTLSGGRATGLRFSRITVGDMLKLTEVGDAMSPEACAAFGVKFAKAIGEDEKLFTITTEDVTDNVSTAPALACVSGYADVKAFNKKLDEKVEFVPTDPITSEKETVIKLAYPYDLNYTVGEEAKIFRLEWLTFHPQKYKDVSLFVRSYFRGDANWIVTFIRSYGKMMNLPEDYPMKKMTNFDAERMDAADAERIASLVAPNFIELPQ